MADIQIQIVSSSGKPLKGKSVSVGCDELMALWTSPRKTTDDNGMVTFSAARNNFVGSIYINGQAVVNKKKIHPFNKVSVN